MGRITKHSKDRMVQRISSISNRNEAKRLGKLAYRSGKTINEFQKYPKFFNYLTNKKNQTNDCSLRVYKDSIFIWRGKNRNLVTVHPIPDRYKEEMRVIDNVG